MRLRKQLLLLALLSFSLPWAGAKLIVKVENALRASQEHSARISARTMATSLGRDINAPARNPAIFLPWRELPLQDDGYSRDWEHLTASILPGPDERVNYKTQRDEEFAYLLIQVNDAQVSYYNPAGRLLKNGDRAHLSLNDRTVALTSSAPGRIAAKFLRDGRAIEDSSIQAYWRDTDDGYQIEARLPLSEIDQRFAIAVVDDQAKPLVWRSDRNGQAVSADLSLKQALQAYVNEGTNLQLLSPEGWPLLQLGSLHSKQSPEVNWVLRKLYRSLLPPPATGDKPEDNLKRNEISAALQGATAMQWYKREQRSDQHLLASAAPIYHNNEIAAVLVLEKSSEPFLTLTDAAFTTLIGSSLVALLLTLAGFLLYASWLSYRVRQLSLATSASLSRDGQINKGLPQAGASDEIGELSRSFTSLLENISEFTDYLQTLSRKLSHELRTPLAVVRSSLDNLAAEPLSPDAERYLQRAQEGSAQLSHLITALSEATRVEQSIISAEKERCDLRKLLGDITQAYQDIYQHHQLTFTAHGDDSTIEAAPELLVQMMDKLVANAVDFAPAESTISISLTSTAASAEISVYNSGSQLDPGMRDKLFDSMVSLRKNSESKEPHLGLGLYIVKLIAEFHNGQVGADNHQQGVIFSVRLNLD
jgi:signal transduction histidine kinase